MQEQKRVAELIGVAKGDNVTGAMARRPLASLVISRWGPVAPKGGSALRNLQNIRALANLGTVDVVSIGLEETEERFSHVREWKHFQARRLAAQRSAWDRLRGRSWRLRFNDHPRMDQYWHREVAKWISFAMQGTSYDLVVIAEIALARYLRMVRPRTRCVVYDAHNLESVLASDLDAGKHHAGASWWRCMSRRMLNRRMQREERRLVRGCDAVWACSEADAAMFERIFGSATPVAVVPNGVDVASYGGRERVANAADWSGQPVTVLYMGSYPYYPNEDAAIRLLREVMPCLRKREPGAKAVLVGREPTPAMRAAAGSDPNITITGSVDSIMPFLTSPCVVALPITLGGGTRLKILEAFAAGAPVVSSRKGAEGIDAIDGAHLFLRDDPEDFARAVAQVWHDNRLRTRMCSAAYELVSERYSWGHAQARISDALLCSGVFPK